MRIETVSIGKVKPNPNNPRVIRDEQFRQLVKSINEFPEMLELREVVVDENYMVLGGNMRLRALQKAGIKNIIVKIADGLTEEQKKEFIIKDNLSFGSWDFAVLDSDWDTELLKDWGFDTEALMEYSDMIGGSDKDETYKSDKNKPSETIPDKSIMDIPLFDFLKSKETIYVQFSGGKDSMAQVAVMIENGINPERMVILHNSTPNDYPDLKQFVLDYSKQIGAKDCIIIGQYSQDDARAIFNKNGFPLQHMVWCTNSWKIIPMQKFFKELSGKIDVNACAITQGWRREESERRDKASDRTIDKNGFVLCRPIMDMSTEEVFQIIKKHKWNLHKSYKYRSRLSCLYCFAVDRNEWDGMRKHDPENFFHALERVCHGAMSHNIKGETFMNTVRKMMGMQTLTSEKNF